MATDALLSLQPLTTKTATFSGAAFFLAGGTRRRGLKARVIYSAAQNATGSNTVIFSVDVSKDGGVTYYTEFQTDPITLSTTVQAGQVHIPFEVSPTSVVNGIYIRTTATIAGAGTGPSVAYQCDIDLGRP